MYLIEPFFKLTALENDIGQQSRLLNAIIDQWRYNGQIIGREIPLYFTLFFPHLEQYHLFLQNPNV